MKTTVSDRIPESICDSCGAIVEHVEVVQTLGATGCGLGPEHAEPAEYGDRCPECQTVTSFTGLDDESIPAMAGMLHMLGEAAAERYLIHKRHMTYGDARSVIRQAKAVEADTVPAGRVSAP